ncbi:MAG: N-acetyltransferase [Rhodospirillales bacterium]|nr:N-acetyltransferase [Rhodospirillales bacterium]
MIRIANEQPKDSNAIEALLDRLFSRDRRSKASYAFRRETPPVTRLSLVARDRGHVVGTVRYWPVEIGGARTPALLLGPIGVSPLYQGKGVGGALMSQSLALAAATGHRIVLLVGDRAYYARFQFRPAAPLGLSMPDEQPHRLLVRELVPDALEGVKGGVRPWRAVTGWRASSH